MIIFGSLIRNLNLDYGCYMKNYKKSILNISYAIMHFLPAKREAYTVKIHIKAYT